MAAVELSIAQALFQAGNAGSVLLARSDNFREDFEELCSRIVEKFGTHSKCSKSISALPLGNNHIAVIHAAQQPPGSPESKLTYRFLVLGKPLYQHLGDPFLIDDKFPPDWLARGSLPNLEMAPQLLPPRTVELLQTVLKDGDTPLLLGAAQCLVDGGKILLQHRENSETFLRGLWQLLPDQTRCEIWPATFASNAEQGFHIAAVPELPPSLPDGILTEEQTRDYPEGRYELSLQMAVESGNQRELERLLARRSSAATLRMALYLVVAVIAFAVVSKLLG